MILAIGSDHAAFEAKKEISVFLGSLGYTVLDKGTFDETSCDYPDFAAAVAKAIQGGETSQGILICGTGIGMSIAANRFKGIRAALCYTPELAALSRQHNDANVLCLGARTQTLSDMQEIVKTWLANDWEGERHAQRLKKIETNVRG